MSREKTLSDSWFNGDGVFRKVALGAVASLVLSALYFVFSHTQEDGHPVLRSNVDAIRKRIETVEGRIYSELQSIERSVNINRESNVRIEALLSGNKGMIDLLKTIIEKQIADDLKSGTND
jgi:hypothetical protein